MKFYITAFLGISVFLFSCSTKRERGKPYVEKVSKAVTGIVNTDSVAPPEIIKMAPPQTVVFTKTVIKRDTLQAGRGINYFTSYTTEQGYPVGSVRDMLFDKDGVVWMTELNRIVKYDGVHFTSFGIKNGLSAMVLISMARDGKGNIWMNRFDGLSKYDGVAFTNYDTIGLLKGNQKNFTLLSDPGGNIWFSIQGKGICKYDGMSFTVFSTRDDLPSDSMTITLMDKEGNLWLNSSEGESGIFDGRTYKAFTRDDWTKGKTVRVLFKDSGGNIWYRSSRKEFSGKDTISGNEGNSSPDLEEGILKFDGQKITRFTTFDGLPSNTVNDITEDPAGNIWLATDRGVSRYTGGGFTNYTKENGLSTDYAAKLLKDPAGNLWVIGRPGVSKFNGAFLAQYTDEMGFMGLDGSTGRFVNDSLGNLWFAINGGIGKYDGHEFTYYKKAGLRPDENNFKIGSLLLAKDGSIWFSLGPAGCYRFDGNSFLFYKEIVTYAYGIFQDSKGIFWFSGPNGKGVYKFDGGTLARYSKTQGLGSNNIFNVTEDRSGNIWLGRRQGFSKFDGRHFTNYDIIQSFGNNSSSRIVVAGKNDLIWYASDSGLIKFDGKAITNYGITDRLADGTFNNIVEDTFHKKIWLTTSHCLSAVNTGLVDKLTGKELVENYNYQTGFPGLSKMFRNACIDRKGVLWFSDNNRILTRFDYALLQQNRLPRVFIKNVTLDNENISWRHLRSKQPGKNLPDSMAIVNELGMRFPDGFSAEALKSMSGRYSGVRFDSISPGNPAPFHLKIPFRHNTIGFEFGVSDPGNAGQVQYQYMLEGYDNTWSKPDKITKAGFGNMNEGTYTFQVRARYPNGQWMETRYVFTVLPPWYRSWWAYVLYVLVAGTALLTFIRLRTKKLQREKAVLETNVAARTAELQESLEHLKATQGQLIQSEKMASLGELTAGIAHEIQNPLNFVNNFSEVSNELVDEMKEEITKGNYDEVSALADDVKQNLEKIQHHGKRADAIVKGMLQHSRSSSGQKEPTDINALCDEYLRLAHHGLRAKDKYFNTDIKTDFDPSVGMVAVVPQDIGRVLLNLINNAFYAVNEREKLKANSQQLTASSYQPVVSVSTKKTGNNVAITVADNGSGIPRKVLDKIFQPFFTTKPTGQGTGLGLSLSYDIIRAHGGEISVETKEGEGTEFTISLPFV